MEEIVGVGLAQPLEIPGIDAALEIPGPLLDPLQEHLDRRLHVDHEVWLSNLLFENRVELFVNSEIGVIKIQIGKYSILWEGVVGQYQPLKEVHLRDFTLLLKTRQQKIDLDLEGGACAPLVERRQERIGNVLEHHDAFESFGEELDERGLTDPDRAFDGDMPEGNLVPHHSVRPLIGLWRS